MSRDQRPGKIRVISTASQNRPSSYDGKERRDVQATPVNAGQLQTSAISTAWLAILFLIGCSAGGTILSYTGLVSFNP